MLKPDVPRLDTVKPEPQPEARSEPLPRAPLKGQVQHQAKPGPPLRGQAGAAGGGLGSLRGRADGGRLRGRASGERMRAQVESGIGIIGVKFVMYMGKPPIINRVFPLTPAAQLGLRVNDVIVAVDGVPTLGLTKEEVYDMIVGMPGTPVTLSLSRNGDFQVVTLTRMDLNDISDPWVRRDYMTHM